MVALLANLKWMGGFLAVVGLGFLSLHGINATPPDYHLTVPVENAAGLYPGSDVLIAGSRAGQVADIKLNGSTAMITFRLDPAFAPVHSDVLVALRPKSLLGEEYVSVNPGRNGAALRSGTVLEKDRVTRSTDLEQIINTFDEPTRAKLQVVVTELGGGLAGRGPGLNETIRYGTGDLKDLRQISDTLARRDQDLQTVISALDDVTGELARDDRRQQLGDLIKNADVLLKALADQDAALKNALTQTNAALARTDTALGGTEGNLKSIFHQLPVTVTRLDTFTRDLGLAADDIVPTFGSIGVAGLKETPIVFGGKDAAGYATRVTLLAGGGTSGGPVLPTPTGTPLPLPTPTLPPGLPSPPAPLPSLPTLPSPLPSLNPITDYLINGGGQ